VQSASKKQSEEVVFSDLFIYLFVCLLDFPQVVGTDFRETFQRVGCLWPWWTDDQTLVLFSHI